MSRFVKIATGLRDFGSDINSNISKALNISKTNSNPNKSLLEEASAGRLRGIEAILDQFQGAVDINGALDRDFMSPLCLACAGGHEDAALLLLTRAGADPNNAAGVAAAAAAGGRCEADACGEFGEESSVRAAPSPPLLLAVEAGLARTVRELVARGARVDTSRVGDGWNALHVCASQGNAQIMSELLNAPLVHSGARTARLETPLSIACSRGHLSVVDLLCNEDEDEDDDGRNDERKNNGDDGQDKQADDEQEDRQDDGGDNDSNRNAGGAESKSGDDAAFAPITAVAANRRGHHCQAEERTWAGRTPLHRAAQNGYTEVVLRLLVHGVSVDPADKDGVTPLMLAARGGHWATARELIRKGKASVNAAADEGDTALHVAAAAGGRVRKAERVVKILLKAGADVDAQNVHGSTALHLAAAVGAYDSLLLLLSAGANPTTVNSCGLSPGSFFLEPPHGAGRSEESIEDIRRALREQRKRNGHLRRLADSSAKREMVATVAGRAAAFIHGSVEFALKTQRWDLDAREHRTRLRRLGKFQAEILSDPPRVTPGTTSGADGRGGDPRPPQPHAEARTPPPLLLDLSPEREGRAARAVKKRRAAAAEAVRGAKIALKDLEDWKRGVLAERATVTSFLRNADPARAFAVGNTRRGGDYEDDEEGASLNGDDAFGGSWSFLYAEGFGRGESRKRESWPVAAGTSPDSNEGPGCRRGERGGPVGFVRALAALDPCVGAIRKATSAAKSEDHLSAAFETLREHVKSTLIDLMDLETSIPGEGKGARGDVDVGSGDDDEEGERRDVGTGPTSSTSFTPAEATALDSKIGGLLDRLSGSPADDNSDDESNQSNYRVRRSGADVDSGGYRSGRRSSSGTQSLATVYAKGLGGAATLAEAEVETAERLTAIAMRMVVGAAVGPLLRALDNAYQRLIRADRDVRQMLPEAEALMEGPGSEEERMRESRSRLVTIRQQVVDEADLLEELVSKLRRRKRQAAGNEEIGAIEEECLQVRARHAALRSVKLVELKALRQSGAYQRFPELLLEHPNRAEVAFCSMLVGGITLRDPDEWTEHHMASLLPVHAGGSGIVGGGGGGGCASPTGGGDRMLDGIGGKRCRLAEIDGSAVALVEVDCRDREAERSLVASLLRFASLERHHSGSGAYLRATPELAAVTGVALDGDRALLEVPVEGTLTAKAWLCTGALSAEASGAVAVAEAGQLQSPLSVGVQDLAQALNLGKRKEPGVTQAPKPKTKEEPLEAEISRAQVWAVMVQALRGLVAVHAVSEESTHGAVCLSNILVAARSAQQAAVGVAAGPEKAAGIPYPLATQLIEVETKGTAASRAEWSASSMLYSPRMRGFRRAQLAPPSPAALAQPPTEYVAPEVVRGQPFRQPADVYAFGIALRAAFCGGHEEATYYSCAGESGSNGGGGGSAGTGTWSVLPPGRGPADGPLRLALTEVLEKMLEEHESRRCTALEALMSDFLRVPPGESPKLYPSTWSTFPVIHRGISDTTPGTHPHWVANALSAGRKDVVVRGRGWWESCFAVDVLSSQAGPTSGDETAKGERGESSEIEKMLRRSLPGARLHRLVRLQDRGRWLRFVCERDGVIASVSSAASSAGPHDLEDGTAINLPPVARFFADPRDVVSLEALSAIAAQAAPTSMAAKIGGRTVQTTVSKMDDELVLGDPAAADHFSKRGAASVRCTKEARFAAVAFALPPGGGEEVEGKGGEEVYENIRTVAVIRAVTGVSDEQREVAEGRAKTLAPVKASALSQAAGIGGLVMSTPSTGKGAEDPFLGVEPSIDDLTRVGGISILSSGSAGALVDGSSSSSAAAAAATGNGTSVALLPVAVGLSSHAVNSIKTYESLGADAGDGHARSPALADDDATTAVFTVRREACYPEYLATFSFPPHAA